MAVDNPEIRITIGEGEAAREVVCRRPTRGEYDSRRVQALLEGVAKQHGAIRSLEEGPSDGAAEKIAHAMELAEDGLRSIQKRVLGAVDRIAPESERPALRSWMTEDAGGVWAERVFQALEQIADALAPPSLPGK